jgi:hypothetical protein
MNQLRGIVHVRVWRQQPLADWDEPPCTTLAPLKAEVKKALAANQKINDGLYQKIGKHLNPGPNRTSGTDRVPVCAICEHERENSRHRYWWMLVFLAVFPQAESRPKLVLTAQHTDSPPPLDTVSPANGLDRLEPTGASPTTHRRYQRSMAGALLGILLLAGIGISAGVGRGQALSAPQSDLPRASSSPSTNPLSPEQPGNNHTSRPGGSANGGPAGGPHTGSTGGSDSPPPGDTAAPPAPTPGPCDHVLRRGGGPYRPFIGSTGVLCWLSTAGWRQLEMSGLRVEMSGLRAKPQDIEAVDVNGGRAVFFTATDSYVWGTIVDSDGNISGWHRFFERADAYTFGFNISTQQSVTRLLHFRRELSGGVVGEAVA